MNDNTRLRLVQAGLAIAGIAFLAVGLQGLLAPKPLLWKVHIRLDAVDAVNEARAVYGGMHIAIGSLFLFGLARKRQHMHRTLLKLWTFLVAGLVFGRVVGIGMDGFPPGFARILLALEASGIVLGVVMLKICPAAPAAPTLPPPTLS